MFSESRVYTIYYIILLCFFHQCHRIKKKDLSICQSLLCLDLELVMIVHGQLDVKHHPAYSPHRGAGLTIPTRCDQYPEVVRVLAEALPELFRRLFRSYLSTYFWPETGPEPDPGWDGLGLGFGTGCASISAWPQKLVMSFAFPRSNRLTSGGTLLPLRN